ncbi:MAG: SAM-dependent methyltransferase [Lachnospiraceae bacterium]|nr:SAM-dependent methyltransferase [Lachnospiraceae bacterium]
MELSKRLQAVADMVTEGSRVADIGCDHGYTSIYLCREKKCPHIIAMDVKKGPLERAKANINKYNLSDYIETRLSDGTEALGENEADTLLMSGMGGRLTIRILERAFGRLGKSFELVLQPQSEIFLVRAFLREEGIKIVDEAMVLDQGKYYPVIKARPEDGKESTADGNEKSREKSQDSCEEKSRYTQTVRDYFGPVLLDKRPAVFLDFLKKEKEKTNTLLSRVTKEERRKELQEYLSYVEAASGNEAALNDETDGC